MISELRLRAHDLTGLFVDCSTFFLLQGNEVLESAHFLFVSTPHAELLVLPMGAAILKLSVAGAATSTQRISAGRCVPSGIVFYKRSGMDGPDKSPGLYCKATHL